MIRCTVFISLLLATFGSGCADSDSPEQNCVPGEQTVCACLDDEQGVQVCASDGLSYGPCTGCGEGTGGASSSSSTAGTGTGTTTSTSQASSSSTGTTPMFFTLDDPLDQTTTGNLVGGTLTAAGWRVDARTDRLWFDIPALVDGKIEFTVTGMSNTVNDNMPLNDHEIFTMYEAGYGIAEPIRYNPEYRNNFFKSMIRVYGEEPGREGQQKLLWVNCNGGSPGFSQNSMCPCPQSFGEEPFTGDGTWTGAPERLRVEWKHDMGAKLFRNDVEIVAIDFSNAPHFGPSALHFALGSARADAVDTAGMPIGAVFSDLHVEGWTGVTLDMCH